MTDEDHNAKITAAVEDGSYFRNARSWYETLYIMPISDFALFIVLTLLGALIAFIGLFAWQGFLPLRPRAPFIYIAQDIDTYTPSIKRLRDTKQPVDDAVQKFLVKTFIRYFESYNAQRMDINQRYVMANSTQNVIDIYRRQMSPSNPRSPLVRLGQRGTREVSVGTPKISMTPNQGILRADVPITVREILGSGITDSNWVVTIEFMYTMLVNEEKELELNDEGDIGLKVEDTQFVVTSYDAREVQGSR